MSYLHKYLHMNKNSQVSPVTLSLNTIKLQFLCTKHIKHEFSIA